MFQLTWQNLKKGLMKQSVRLCVYKAAIMASYTFRTLNLRGRI